VLVEDLNVKAVQIPLVPAGGYPRPGRKHPPADGDEYLAATAVYSARPDGTQTVTEPGWTLMRSFLLAGRAPPSSS
jgi:hypothetical protein